jgi:nucleotide-binding universal stress UspA family protein
MFQHILVPLDGSKLAEAALPVAASLAKTCGAGITLIHVIEKNAPQAIHGEHHLTNPDEAYAYLDRQALQAFPAGVQVDQHVHTTEVSNVARSIVDHAGEFAPDLIVMCSHGSGGLRDILVGNIAQQVIAQGKTPVLLIHPQDDTLREFQCKEILVPMDGKPAHEHGLDLAAGLAQAYHATLTLLFVVPTLGTLGGHQAATGLLLPGTMSALLDMNEQAAYDYLDEQARRARKPEMLINAAVVRGDPGPTIADYATTQGANLIVLGTHGKSGAGAFWAGSVAPKLAGMTIIPLLFVPVLPSKNS